MTNATRANSVYAPGQLPEAPMPIGPAGSAQPLCLKGCCSIYDYTRAQRRNLEMKISHDSLIGDGDDAH